MSIYRATSATEESLRAWFDVYKAILREKKIDSGIRIWNIDETGVVNNPKTRKVLGEKGVKTAFLTPGDHGQTTTILAFVNAVGVKTKPMIIHKGKRVQESWKPTCLKVPYCDAQRMAG